MGIEGNQDKKEAIKIAGMPVTMFLAGMLANHAIEGPRSDAEIPQAHTTQQSEVIPGSVDMGYVDTVGDGYVQDNPGSDYEQQYTFGESSYELSASLEASQAVRQLDDNLGWEFTVTPEQRTQVRATIDAYVAAYHAKLGKTTAEQGPNGDVPSSGEMTYDPLYDLGRAASNQYMNPLLRGILLDELSSQMKKKPE
jgi:hypothetical protein